MLKNQNQQLFPTKQISLDKLGPEFFFKIDIVRDI